MCMTSAYLLARKEPVTNIKVNQSYRVVGWYNSGGIFTVSKIEKETIFFKGYVDGADRKKVLLFLVD